jgi:hypothetical protein
VIHKAANEALSKSQKERRRQWWMYDIEPLLGIRKEHITNA